MILLYLQTRAIKTDSRIVELGESMREWMERMGLPQGGSAYKEVRRQAHRISTCSLTFFTRKGELEARHNGAFVENEISLRAGSRGQGELFPETVELNSTFFKVLKERPVPVWEPALRQISSRSLAIDIYVWLSYRLHSLAGPTPLSWRAVYDQFGSGYARMKQFKPEFIKNLELAVAAYPDTRVDVTDAGVTLYPARSPIERRVYAIGHGR